MVRYKLTLQHKFNQEETKVLEGTCSYGILGDVLAIYGDPPEGEEIKNIVWKLHKEKGNADDWLSVHQSYRR